MITVNVLSKGQIVIPKAIRDLLGINTGDEMLLDVETDRIVLKTKYDPVEVFREVSGTSKTRVSAKSIKKDLEARYDGN